MLHDIDKVHESAQSQRTLFNDEKKFVIYALLDPRDGSVRYIGYTIDVCARFAEHLKRDGSNERKDAWFWALKAVHQMVIMKTLDVVSSIEEARAREKYWIHYYPERGANLVNNTILNISQKRRNPERRIDVRWIDPYTGTKW